MSETTWRLIIDPPASAAWNMAVDEALLDRCAAEEGGRTPTLRLYAFHPGALSLGRHQPATTAHAPRFLRAEGLALVRRPTGGRAVLHELERTYAVIGRLHRDPFPGGMRETHERIAAALALGLRRLGVEARPAGPRSPGARAANATPAGPACFATVSEHELVLPDGVKLVGSAQLRRREAFLQHGSIPLVQDPVRVARAVGDGAALEGCRDLSRALGRPVSPAEVDAALVGAFTEAFSARFEVGGLDAREAERAAVLASWKYASAAWTHEAKLGRRERRWGPPDLASAGR